MADGLACRDASFRPIGVLRALWREILVWVNGLGIGIPFVTIVTLIMAYRRLDGDAITSWDDKLGLVVLHRPRGTLQTVSGVSGSFSMSQCSWRCAGRTAHAPVALSP